MHPRFNPFKPIPFLLIPLLLFLSVTGPVSADYSVGSKGNVIGATSAADNAIPRFNGTSGKLLQDSGIKIDDTDALDLPQLGSAPSNPAASRFKLYFRASALYYLTSGGTETAVGGGTPTAITVADAAGDTSTFVLLATDATGDLGPKTDAGLAYNATSNVLTAGGFVGPLTGNVTGDTSGNAGTVTFADAGGDTSTFVALGTTATGNLAPATDAGLSYQATTNVLTASGGFVGNVTGNLTGNADTVTTNANLTGDVTSTGNATTIANDAVSYAKMQDVSATSRLLGRTTAGAGNVEEVVLDADDTLAADSDSRVATQQAVKAYVDASAGGGSTSLSLNEFRLTLATATPYLTSDQTAKTTVFWTPATGNGIALWDGDSWETYTTTEKSIKLTDTQSCTLDSDTTIVCTDASQLIATMEVTGTGIPGSTTISSIAGNTVTLTNAATQSSSQSITFKVAASTVLDYFVYQASGTPKLRMIKWTNSTTRATALDCTTGVCYLTGDATYRYVGSGATTATAGQTELSFGGLGAGGTEAKWLLWNEANRRPITAYVADSTDSWTHANNSTWTAANGSSTNRATVIVGRSIEPYSATYNQRPGQPSSTTGAIALAVDSTSAPDARSRLAVGNTGATASWMEVALTKHIAEGSHFITPLTYSAGGTSTFYGDNGGTILQTALLVQGWY